jgi:hypothetical protein
MLTIRPGSHAYRLLQFLSTAGEIPANALALLGNERVLAALVHKLESVQEIRFDKSGKVYNVKLLQVSGQRNDRTIRLYKKGLPVLDELHPGLYDLYMNTFQGHDVSGDRSHILRNHRVAEVLACCMAADIEIRPYVLPPLQKSAISRVVPNSPGFYIARDFKKTDTDGANKTMYTRIIGALFYPGGVYAAYNTRNSVMKWSGRGEIKTSGNLLELARMNAGLNDISSALLFGQSAETAMTTILESDKSRRPDLRFDRIYRNTHFVPLNADGIRLLKLLVLPNRNERLLNALFEPGQRSYDKGSMEYDAIVDGRKILSHLDSNVARLIRFREALKTYSEPADVLCFPWQTEFLRNYLGTLAGLRELDPDTVEAAVKG